MARPRPYRTLCLTLLLALSLFGTRAPGQEDRTRYEGEDDTAWIDGSEPDMPVKNSDTGGWTHQDTDTRQQIVIDETFTVAAGEEEIFDNQIVWIRPNARGELAIHGTLVVQNSLLLWDQTEHQQVRLRVKGGGVLEIEDSYAFPTNTFWVNWEFEDGATVSFDRFVSGVWSSIHGSVDYRAVNFSTVSLTLFESTRNTSVIVDDAHQVEVEFFPPSGEAVEVVFPETHAWIDAWDVNDMWPNTTVEFRDSYVRGRDISMSRGTHVVVRDTPSGFNIGWAIFHPGQDFIIAELRDLGDPNEDEGRFYADKTWDIPEINSSLRVVNSVLMRAWPNAFGNVHLKVHNSNLVDTRVYGPATYEIHDSTVDHVAAYQGAEFYVEDTKIRYDIEAKDPQTKVHVHGVSSREESSDFEVIEVDGGQFIEQSAPGTPWWPGSAPVLLSVSPNRAFADSTVVLRGDRLLQTTRVLFSGAEAEFEVDSDTRLTLVVPAAATSGPIKVVTADGESESAFTFNVAFLPPNQPYVLEYEQGRGAGLFGSTALNPGQEFTLEAWAWVGRDIPANTALISFGHDVSPTFALRAGSHAGDVILDFMQFVKVPSDDEAGVQARDVSYGDRWVHMAGTVEASTMRLYIDGAYQGADTLRQPIPSGSLNINTGGFSGFPGRLRQVRLWDRALTGEEILASAQRVVRGDEEGLIGAWPLDDGAGQRARDTGPGALHLTLGQASTEDAGDPLWVTTDDAPAAPVLEEPAKGGVSGTLARLSWVPAVLSQSSEVEIATTPTFETLIDNGQVSGSSIVIGDLLYGQSYYWRVRTSNAHGNGDWSEVSSFTVVPKQGDFDASGRVDFTDFFRFADAYGSSDPLFDLNGDLKVDVEDFFLFADVFGS